MKKELKAKLLLLVTTYSVLFNSMFSKKAYADEIEYNDNYHYLSSEPFAYYNDKKIYIGHYADRTDESNIYIIDERGLRDSDLKICDSYKIVSIKEMKGIIDILCEYENNYPSNWNRSKESMLLEWVAHNLCYYLDIEAHRSGDVDLNNADELNYRLIKK